MICLACGGAQKGEVGAKCPKCDFEHGRVDGIHGVNNVTQLFTTLEDFRNGRCDLDTLLERFDTFAGKWDGFQKRWHLDKDAAPELFDLDETKKPFYEPSLNELEDAFVHLNDAFELLDELEEPDHKILDEITLHIRRFFHGVCSSCATVFSKLDSPKGDLGGLLNALGDN